MPEGTNGRPPEVESDLETTVSGSAESAPPGTPLKRTLARNTSANAIAQFATALSAFVLMPFLIHSFGVATYGIYVFTSSLSGYLTFLDFGVGLSLTKLLAEYRGKGEDGEVGKLVSSALAFYTVIGVVATIVLLLGAKYAVGWFHFSPAEQRVAQQLLLVGAAFSPIMWPLSSVTSVQAGLNRYDINAKATLATVVLNAIATVLVVAFHLGPVVLVAAISFDTAVVSIWNWRQASALMGDHVEIGLRHVDPKALGPIIRLSVYIFIIQLSTVLIYQQTDRLIVGFFVGAAAVTVYEAAAKIESAVRQVGGLMSSAVVPATSHLASQEAAPALHRLLLKGTRYTVFVVTPIALGLMVLARPLLSAWLGSGLVVATIPVQVYLSYWLINANSMVMGSMILGAGRLDRVIWWQNLATALNLLLGVLLTWKFGVIGVILGTVVSHVVILPIYLRIGFRLFGVTFADWMREVALPAYPALLVVVAVAVAGRLLGVVGSLLGVAVTGLLSVGAYWLYVYLVALDAEERHDISSLLRLVGRRLGIER